MLRMVHDAMRVESQDAVELRGGQLLLRSGRSPQVYFHKLSLNPAEGFFRNGVDPELVCLVWCFSKLQPLMVVVGGFGGMKYINGSLSPPP